MYKTKEYLIKNFLKRLFGVSGGLILLFSSVVEGDGFFSDINQNSFFTDTDNSPDRVVQSKEQARFGFSDSEQLDQSATEKFFDTSESAATTSFFEFDFEKQLDIIKKSVFNLMDYHLPNLAEKSLFCLEIKTILQ